MIMDKPQRMAECWTCKTPVLTRTVNHSSVRCGNCAFKDNLMKNYRITVSEYNTLLVNQDNKCAVCGALASESRLPGPKHAFGLVIDHCHITDTVRGLVCNHCNRLLGACGDDIGTLAKAIGYLASHTY